MSISTNSAALVILLGIVASTQNHLAKALQRQGIEVFDMLRTRLQRTGEAVPGGLKKPLIYSVGLILNHTVFLYHLLVAPLKGNTALYTSMYGMGMVTLLIYSAKVLKESISRLEMLGALSICLGTLVLGLEGIARPALDMSTIDLNHTAISLAALLGICGLLILAGVRNGSPKAIGLLFGLCAGICGCLDPFLKGVGQAAGGAGKFLPHGSGGWILLAFSFLIGEMAVVVTQFGFIRRTRANILVPAYNCSYVAVPVVLQALLLPGFALYWSTGLGLMLIMLGIVIMRGFQTEPNA